MTEQVSLEDFYNYLSHVEKCYPHGVNESFISDGSEQDSQAPTPSWLWGSGQVGVCFAAALPAWKEHPFESKPGMLLHAAISKGMEIMPEHASVIDTNRIKNLNGSLLEFFNTSVPEVVVILGEKANENAFSDLISAAPGGVVEADGISYMQSFSLEEIMSSVDIKREFWNTLKKALVKLGV